MVVSLSRGCRRLLERKAVTERGSVTRWNASTRDYLLLHQRGDVVVPAGAVASFHPAATAPVNHDELAARSPGDTSTCMDQRQAGQ
jgi:hypothetical protein